MENIALKKAEDEAAERKATYMLNLHDAYEKLVAKGEHHEVIATVWPDMINFFPADEKAKYSTAK
jgi:hypothetical protein